MTVSNGLVGCPGKKLAAQSAIGKAGAQIGKVSLYNDWVRKLSVCLWAGTFPIALIDLVPFLTLVMRAHMLFWRDSWLRPWRIVLTAFNTPADWWLRPCYYSE